MAIFTEREHRILEMLKAGKQVQEIAKELGVPRSSISRSIREIRLALFELKGEIEFLQDIGIVSIEKNMLRFAARDMDPKILLRK